MTLDLIRLAKDRDYWDENAPEGEHPTHYLVGADQPWQWFPRMKAEWVEIYSDGEVFPSIYPVIPRPEPTNRRMWFGVVAALVLLSALALTANAETVTQDEFCEQVERTAAQFMSARQNGVPASTMMEIAAGDPLARRMVLDAYAKPAFRTDQHQQRIVREFGDSWYIRCMTEVE